MKDAVTAGILDLYLVKYWALKFATDAAVTILRVDQVRSVLGKLKSHTMTNQHATGA